jgi:hypothetical protein
LQHWLLVLLMLLVLVLLLLLLLLLLHRYVNMQSSQWKCCHLLCYASHGCPEHAVQSNPHRACTRTPLLLLLLLPPLQSSIKTSLTTQLKSPLNLSICSVCHLLCYAPHGCPEQTVQINPQKACTRTQLLLRPPQPKLRNLTQILTDNLTQSVKSAFTCCATPPIVAQNTPCRCTHMGNRRLPS